MGNTLSNRSSMDMSAVTLEASPSMRSWPLLMASAIVISWPAMASSVARVRRRLAWAAGARPGLWVRALFSRFRLRCSPVYGPTVANPAPHWYEFNDGFKVTSANTYTLEVQDGGLGDDDLQANGVVVDPGGLMVMAATSAAAIPVWNLAGLAATSASVLLAMAAMRRRRRTR